MSREYIGKWRVSYCKKLTLVAKLDVARMLGAQTEVLGRAQAAEFAEIMNEVGLVGITARESDIDPVDCGRFRVDRRSNRRFRISDLRCRTRPISKFPHSDRDLHKSSTPCHPKWATAGQPSAERNWRRREAGPFEILIYLLASITSRTVPIRESTLMLLR